MAGGSQLLEQRCRSFCVANVLEQEQVFGAEKGWSRSSGNRRQGAVCWGCPKLQRVLPAAPPACVSLACGVPFRTRWLGLGHGLSSVADREALPVRSPHKARTHPLAAVGARGLQLGMAAPGPSDLVLEAQGLLWDPAGKQGREFWKSVPC